VSVFVVLAGSNCDIAEGGYRYCFIFLSGISKHCCSVGKF